MAISSLVEDGYSILRPYWPLIALFVVLARLLWNRYGYGLNDVPGPFLASLTDLWLFFHVLFGKAATEYELHCKYNSPIIRLGPNTLSFNDAESLRKIYGYRPVFHKSDFYLASSQVNASGELYSNLASTMDEEEHARLRRPLAHAYSMTTLVGYESRIDSTFQVFTTELERRFVATGAECPLHSWLQMYAFDVIGELTLSRRLGFLESGTDFGNMMHYTGLMLRYVGIMGHLPLVDKILRLRNPLIINYVNKPVLQFTLDLMREHEKNREKFTSPDLLTHFKNSAQKYPEIMDHDRIADNARSAIGAGSDTTAIVLRELVYQLLTHPKSLVRVMEEIKTALAARPKDAPHREDGLSWAEGVKMHYFQACMKECLRVHSPLGQMLLRASPKGGVTLCGRYIPEGIQIGCNAWSAHRNPSLYIQHPDEFWPERWIDSPPELIQKMENASLAFGGGPRICIGKNIALLEITKTIPELFRRFEIELVDPSRYTFASGWLTPQSGLDVRLKSRDPASLLET